MNLLFFSSSAKISLTDPIPLDWEDGVRGLRSDLRAFYGLFNAFIQPHRNEAPLLNSTSRGKMCTLHFALSTESTETVIGNHGLLVPSLKLPRF